MRDGSGSGLRVPGTGSRRLQRRERSLLALGCTSTWRLGIDVEAGWAVRVLDPSCPDSWRLLRSREAVFLASMCCVLRLVFSLVECRVRDKKVVRMLTVHYEECLMRLMLRMILCFPCERQNIGMSNTLLSCRPKTFNQYSSSKCMKLK